MNDLFQEKLLVCQVKAQVSYLNKQSLLASNSECTITTYLQELQFKIYFIEPKINQDHEGVILVIFTIQSVQFTNSNY